MAEYSLNDKQRQLLRVLVPGLKQAKIELEWQVMHGARFTAIFGNGTINLRLLGWHQANHHDFDQLVDQGFLQVTHHNPQGQPVRYHLNHEAIIQAVENGFLLPSPLAD